MSTESSEWTSDTGSEMIVPQRHCSMKRRTRKYLKPRSARILSLEEEGGLFVMYGRKVYPVVQKGKLVKNYVTYTQEDDVEETFWKMKYVEEKKKTDELTKMLNDAKVDKPSSKVGESSSKQEDSSRVSPVQPTTTPKKNKLNKTKANPNPEQQRKTVRIKFIKKNQEVELEGHWSQLNPVLDHVAQLFQKESETISISSSSSKKEESPAGEPLVESGKSTPTDEIVQKVNQREIEIAQEIEKYYKQENIAAENPAELELNVTKRKGRQIKSPSASSSIAKRAKLDVEAKANETAEKASAAEDITTKTRRTRASTNSLSETNQTSSSEANQTYIRTRRSTSRISQDKTATKQDEEVRYKFPSPALSTRKSYANKAQSKVAKNTQQRKSKSATNLVSSSGNVLQTIETTQEYPVSEFCPSPICINGGSKTCLSFSTHTKRHSTTRLQQRTNHNITDDITTESSNSFQTARIESMTFQNSTITSEIYKSESYRLLMNNDPSHTKNTTKLQRIEETSLASKDFDQNKEAFEAIAASDNIDLDNKENALELTQVNTDNENSSNVSLPTSPVLSIVENISISKTMLSSMDLDDFPFDDKAEAIDSPDQIMLNGLMTPDVDVTMPLMEQECGIEKSSHDGKAYHYNLNVSKTIPAVSESLLNQITTVNIGDPSLSESLNVKLKDLLLESTKKRFKNKDTVKKKTEDLDVKDKTEPKKDNSRKRSSTPRKRQRIREPTIPDTEPCLVEEHIESCRHGRQSCPPVILISDHEAGAIITPTETAQFITTRRRNKKDIIKVKILKPKAKTQDTSSKQSDMVDFTDSGINHTESDIKLHGLNDSVDLIHNHSDTCLNAHECMGDSVKIIDNSASSIISLDTNSAHSDIIVRHSTVGNLTQELFSSDAQDGSDVIKEFDFAEPRQVNSESTTVYHTPLGTQSSPTSIITDDLSDEVPEEPVQNKRWYLFSEDESSNTNCFNKNSKTFGCGANLEQIFPVTCAIPDLSTITEISRENGDSKKFCDDTNTRDRLNSPSIFI
ncbi:jg5941 [Pararge aegeria aegeria]|uniref:Jg5941 protein n=1 Tax=Pararge aegeria aegeria TaxID=348720 RepID=A0A8S4REN5_9NEOP|nr:jg5941 [Pararge aegeria aegeria]